MRSCNAISRLSNARLVGEKIELPGKFSPRHSTKMTTPISALYVHCKRSVWRSCRIYCLVKPMRVGSSFPGAELDRLHQDGGPLGTLLPATPNVLHVRPDALERVEVQCIGRQLDDSRPVLVRTGDLAHYAITP